jgi:putative copper resistance protein D
MGSLLVAAIVASGLVNGWFLVGLPGLPRLLTTAYGMVLLAKLAAFAAMAGLAARNRWVHTPALERSLTGGGSAEVRGLRASVFTEAALGAIVLGLVGVLGTLAPISSD